MRSCAVVRRSGRIQSDVIHRHLLVRGQDRLLLCFGVSLQIAKHMSDCVLGGPHGSVEAAQMWSHRLEDAVSVDVDPFFFLLLQNRLGTFLVVLHQFRGFLYTDAMVR